MIIRVRVLKGLVVKKRTITHSYIDEEYCDEFTHDCCYTGTGTDNIPIVAIYPIITRVNFESVSISVENFSGSSDLDCSIGTSCCGNDLNTGTDVGTSYIGTDNPYFNWC